MIYVVCLFGQILCVCRESSETVFPLLQKCTFRKLLISFSSLLLTFIFLRSLVLCICHFLLLFQILYHWHQFQKKKFFLFCYLQLHVHVSQVHEILFDFASNRTMCKTICFQYLLHLSRICSAQSTDGFNQQTLFLSVFPPTPPSLSLYLSCVFIKYEHIHRNAEESFTFLVFFGTRK